MPMVALIDMGDFVGGTLKYLRRHPIERVTLAGGFGKLAKLACGHLDLHSNRSAVDVSALAAWLEQHGAGAALIEDARDASSANQILQLARGMGLPIADDVARRARDAALEQLDGKVALEVIVFDRSGALIGRAKGW